MKPLYLTQARIDMSKPASALASILVPSDSARANDAHHRLIWTLFADSKDRQRDFLWRSDDGQFLILSDRQPEDQHMLFDLRTKLFEPRLARGDRLGFRLRVNAVVTRTEQLGDKKKKRRHDIVMDAMRKIEHSGMPEQLRGRRRAELASEVAAQWITQQGQKNGFALDKLDSSLYNTARLHRTNGRDGRLGFLDLDGVLVVDDPNLLLSAVTNGFGKAKAFGYGLMLLRRA